MTTVSFSPPYGATTTVAGLPVGLTLDANGQYIGATFTTVTLNEAPVEVGFDPPVADISTINLQLVQTLAQAILNGAQIGS